MDPVQGRVYKGHRVPMDAPGRPLPHSHTKKEKEQLILDGKRAAKDLSHVMGTLTCTRESSMKHPSIELVIANPIKTNAIDARMEQSLQIAMS